MFFIVGVLKGFAISSAKHLKACNFIKKRLQHRYFPVNIAKFFRTVFLRTLAAAVFFSVFYNKQLGEVLHSLVTPLKVFSSELCEVFKSSFLIPGWLPLDLDQISDKNWLIRYFWNCRLLNHSKESDWFGSKRISLIRANGFVLCNVLGYGQTSAELYPIWRFYQKLSWQPIWHHF